MSSLRRYQGLDFEVWDNQQSWFWLVVDPSRDGGAIGAALSEHEAVRDACFSIDELIYAGAPMTADRWEISLAKLQTYLSQCCARRCETAA